MEIIGCLSRNTTPTERTLKAIKMVDNNEGPGMSLEHLNDCLLVKSYIAPRTRRCWRMARALSMHSLCSIGHRGTVAGGFHGRTSEQIEATHTQNIRKHRPLSEK